MDLNIKIPTAGFVNMEESYSEFSGESGNMFMEAIFYSESWAMVEGKKKKIQCTYANPLTYTQLY